MGCSGLGSSQLQHKKTNMKAINFLFLLLGIMLLPTQAYSQQNGLTEIEPEAVAAALEAGTLFLDVRETNEVEALAYDLPGVINLPLSELPERLGELPRDRAILLACRSGRRSAKAASLLAENDFTQLFNLTDGIVGWQATGLPVKKMDRSTMPEREKAKQCCSAEGGSKKEGGSKSCCAGKAKTETSGASCGSKEQVKGKSCCAGGSR